jgi:CRISPR system Cascade subunit CasE
MDDVFLSRARLRKRVSESALRQLLVPSDDGRRAGAGHRLIWNLFGDSPDRERDFLWREADTGVFYLLSRRAPVDQIGLFDLEPPKRFAPELKVGDTLAFSLRANATVSKKKDGTGRGKPCDVVMAAIKDIKSGDRAAVRNTLAAKAGREWLCRQGERSGFTLPIDSQADKTVEDSGQGTLRTSYRTMRVDHAGPDARLGIIDFDGLLEVTNPEVFLTAITHGFGRAKAFGCGLMLVRRA